MAEFLAANPWIVAVVVVLALALVWWLFAANRKTRVITTKPDVLDQGAAPARRNQALIDSPSAAATPGSVLGTAPQPAPAPKPAPAPTPAPAPAAKAAPKPKAAAKPKAVPAAKPAPKPKAAAAPKPAPEAKATPKPRAETAPKPAAKPKAASAPEPAPKPAAKPKAAPKPKPAPKTVTPDALLQIKGLGPKMDGLFKGLGITSFAQIAAWTPADIERIDQQLGSFSGRIARDNFVEQAKLLAAGDIAGFEAKFGAL